MAAQLFGNSVHCMGEINTVLAEKLINKYIFKMQLLASLSFTPGVQAVDHVSTEK